jgi:hypothetical protein
LRLCDGRVCHHAIGTLSGELRLLFCRQRTALLANLLTNPLSGSLRVRKLSHDGSPDLA